MEMKRMEQIAKENPRKSSKISKHRGGAFSPWIHPLASDKENGLGMDGTCVLTYTYIYIYI